MKTFKLRSQIRILSFLFITVLIVSGITAFPLQTELNYLVKALEPHPGVLYHWLSEVSHALHDMNSLYPFLSYGTDWLAFAHILISIFFIGVFKDPVRNIWITQTGIISCILIFPLALIAGHIRSVPLFWQGIDCSFGALGLLPLLLIHSKTKQLIAYSHTYQPLN